jgi:hypothetical protein
MAERPEKLAQVRHMVERFIMGIIYMEQHTRPMLMDEKIEAIRVSLEMMGQTWDPAEGPLWGDLIQYATDGNELTDEYLLSWRNRYRVALGIE